MALIRCYECGKEISSLATVCPSCGAPAQSPIFPPPLPRRARSASRAKRLFWGTIALLTGVVLVLVVRAVTNPPNSPSVAPSPTPATAQSTTTSSPPVEMTSEMSPGPVAAETPHSSDAPVAPSPPPGDTYQVIGIPEGDYLNVREGAGADYPVVTKLEPGTGGIRLSTKRIASGAAAWQEITVHGQTGWVNAAYIALETQTTTSQTPSPTESSIAP
jgi:uncharacterized protein YgiM (DUF1202 family)